METLCAELVNTVEAVERLGVLAAFEEEADYLNLLANLRQDRVVMLERLLDESERDRAARLNNMHELDRLLRESEHVRAAYELVVQHQAAQLVYVRHLRLLRSVVRRTVRIVVLPYDLGRRVYQALSRNHVNVDARAGSGQQKLGLKRDDSNSE